MTGLDSILVFTLGSTESRSRTIILGHLHTAPRKSTSTSCVSIPPPVNIKERLRN